MSELAYEFSDESDKVIRDNCHEIEKVYEKRSCTDEDNSKILYKLLAIACGDNQLSQFAIRYICNHNTLPVQLVQIMAETEDLQTCTYSVEILHRLLTYSEVDRTAVKKTLSLPENFGQLLECVYVVHSKFCDDTQYKEVLSDLHAKLLHMIVITYEVKKCRKLLHAASEETVQFLGHLLTVYYKHKELTAYILVLLKVLCLKKPNSDILASKRFYDALYCICKSNQKFLTISIILKLMSRSASALQCMSRNEKIFTLILDLANYNGKKTVSKRTLMTILYRLSKTGQGVKILLQDENFYKLLSYFLKNEKPEVFQQRMGTIKAYTILNRCLKKIVMPASQLNVDLNLPEEVITYSEDSSSEESDREDDDSEEESEEEEVDNEDLSLDDLEFTLASYRKLSLPQEDTFESLSKMNVFFKELIPGADIILPIKLKCQNFERYQILNFAERCEPINHLAYPDAILSEAETDDHYLSPNSNFFSVDDLATKVKNIKDGCDSDFPVRTVYNLDDLCSGSSPPDIPNPAIFKSSTTVSANERSLKFESRFESGNLRSAKQVGPFEYELMMSTDTNSYGGHQWFYFQISSMVPDVTYAFNIVNFIKVNSQYNYGMQPVLFSVADYLINKVGWRRAGEKIIYYGNNYYPEENSIKQYRTLSFRICFPHANDYVYVAYHYPYTYTRLMSMLRPICDWNQSTIYARVDKLCNTVNCANELSLLTVTAAMEHSNSLGIPFEKRPVIFITARVHPGETNSSWIMEGVVKFLLNESDEQAARAREHFIFKIVPMLNPEGVIYGNTRSGLTGVDLNRCWTRPNQITCPEIYYAKKLVECAKKELKAPIAAYIDIHGHSRKKHFFFYGCNPKMSWRKKDRKSGDCLKILKVLPQMVQALNPHIRLNFCRYKIQKKRESTCRVVMWREFGIQKAYTLECSYCSGNNNHAMNTKMLTEIGASLPNALGMIAERSHATAKSV